MSEIVRRHPTRLALVGLAFLFAAIVSVPKAQAHGIHGFPGGLIVGAVIGTFLHHHHHYHHHRKYRQKSHRRTRVVRELGYSHRHCKSHKCGWHWHNMSRRQHRRH